MRLRYRTPGRAAGDIGGVPACLGLFRLSFASFLASFHASFLTSFPFKLPLAFPFKLALWFFGVHVRVRVRVHSRLPLLLDLPLSLFLFGVLVLWVHVVGLPVFACIRGGWEDARKGEVEWKKG
jgi:hypothetical protein